MRKTGLLTAELSTGSIQTTKLRHGGTVDAIRDNRISEFPLPDEATAVAHWIAPDGAFPNRLAVDPHGNVWFTELDTNALGRIDTSGHLEQFPLAGGPVGIVYHRGMLYAALTSC